MTTRREPGHRRRELMPSLTDRLANRVFTRRTTGLDGLAKRLIAKQAPPVEHEPRTRPHRLRARGRLRGHTSNRRRHA
jgi:rRNA maturation protein Rpf1